MVNSLPDMAEEQNAYRVRIHYREPGYERVTGVRRRPYSWTYEVVAPSASVAKCRALSEFELMAASSGVGWLRQVLLVELSEGTTSTHSVSAL